MKKMELIEGYSAFSKREIEEIKSKKGSPDVMLVGMNPSFSVSIFNQLRSNNQKQFDELFIDLRRVLRGDSGGLRNEDVPRLLKADELHVLFQRGPEGRDSVTEEQEHVLRELQYFFLSGRKKESSCMEWMKAGQKEKSISYFDTIRKVLGRLGKDTDLGKDITWYHEDLVDIRETDQKKLIKRLDGEESWNSHIAQCWERIRLVNPKVLLVANSIVAEKLFSNWDSIYEKIPGSAPTSKKKGHLSQRELKWDGEPHFRLCVDAVDSQAPQNPWQGPVVFSRQLSGGCSKAMIHYCLRDLYVSLKYPSDHH